MSASSHRKPLGRGACDFCRRRKSRCDSGQNPARRCTRCINMGLECTHTDLTSFKALASSTGYVTALEGRVQKMERLLTKLLPGIDFTEQLENGHDVEPFVHQHVETLPRNDVQAVPEVGLGRLELNPERNRFFGKSSAGQLVQTALNFQKPASRPSILSHRREEFWRPNPWTVPPPDQSPRYTFPDADLLPVLVNLYFKEVNPFFPVLHRPTFDRKTANNLHLRDPRFASTLLMVCSLGAQHSDDSRVLSQGVKNHPLHYAGWKWHSQVQVVPTHFANKPDLYELQAIALSVLYLQGLSAPTEGWTLIGVGLRRAQDVGAHRRWSQRHPTAENEEWKRVFWVLLCLEWLYCTHTGRPSSMHEGDFDQDLPAECDDEYWDQNFQQPKDKPATISYFSYYIKLLEIQAAVATAIYSPRKPKDLEGHRSASTAAQDIAALDSALNSWLNEVPKHLRWDPDRRNRLHLAQSALLYTAYYNVQILVHRPFIPDPASFHASASGPLPSFTICVNAGRSSARIFDAYAQRGLSVHFNMLTAACTAGIILLIHAWSDKKSAASVSDSPKELSQVYSCLRILTVAEKRNPEAGRFAILISDLLARLIYSEELEFQCGLPPGQPVGPPLTSDSAELATGWFPGVNPSFDPASDELHDGLSAFGLPGTDTDSLEPGRLYDFEKLPTIDAPQSSAAMGLAASSEPSSFQLDDWSYSWAMDMATFSPPKTQTYTADPKQDEQVRRELCAFMG
ncbi:fungal-specific transcription factor domain-containing protein [Mycena vitilis]|nr:fungal-specific transcription factor domain-containing protein [Mycena vitilis]